MRRTIAILIIILVLIAAGFFFIRQRRSNQEQAFEILREAVHAPECEEPFKGFKVISFKEPGSEGTEIEVPIVISKRLPHWPEKVLRYAVSDLVAKGLLYDEGDGRWSISFW